ncbi:hypothetical protein E2562_031424 [Oryza meyeriana var. granulata]|uniref:Uncharacterized protein n=1 Tax=Oryza meyeriana var. granulata TaxID=110450 RepID=A0A6G1C0V6_9ORYZ|nr:hypothetical protein E2562_031424 [Oryza meyeriana var. granulata]
MRLIKNYTRTDHPKLNCAGDKQDLSLIHIFLEEHLVAEVQLCRGQTGHCLEEPSYLAALVQLPNLLGSRATHEATAPEDLGVTSRDCSSRRNTTTLSAA